MAGAAEVGAGGLLLFGRPLCSLCSCGRQKGESLARLAMPCSRPPARVPLAGLLGGMLYARARRKTEQVNEQTVGMLA